MGLFAGGPDPAGLGAEADRPHLGLVPEGGRDGGSDCNEILLGDPLPGFELGETLIEGLELSRQLLDRREERSVVV